METKLPQTIKIVDTVYKIRRFSDTESTGDYGTVDLRRAVISINQEIPTALALRTLWHELRHVDQTNWQEEHDEDDAARFSSLVNQVLIDNPGLIGLYAELQKKKGQK